MKTIKGLLKKSEDQYETLLAYRSTPLSNGYSPAELLMGRKLRTQHGDVRRNRRHLNPTPVAPTYDALPSDVDIPIERDEGEDAPMAVVVPPEPRSNLRDYV